MNNEKRFECDVVVMPGAELDTDICITGNVYMEKGSNACLLYTSPSPRDS